MKIAPAFWAGANALVGDWHLANLSSRGLCMVLCFLGLVVVVRLKFSVLLRGQIAGTVLGYVGQFTVPEDVGIGVLRMQFLQQRIECPSLGDRSRVTRLSVRVESSLVADADRTEVVVAGVDTLHTLGQDWDDFAVAAHIVVVAGLAEAGFAGVDQLLHSERTVATGGRAVDYQQFDCVVFQRFHRLAHDSCWACRLVNKPPAAPSSLGNPLRR